MDIRLAISVKAGEIHGDVLVQIHFRSSREKGIPQRKYQENQENRNQHNRCGVLLLRAVSGATALRISIRLFRLLLRLVFVDICLDTVSRGNRLLYLLFRLLRYLLCRFFRLLYNGSCRILHCRPDLGSLCRYLCRLFGNKLLSFLHFLFYSLHSCFRFLFYDLHSLLHFLFYGLHSLFRFLFSSLLFFCRSRGRLFFLLQRRFHTKNRFSLCFPVHLLLLLFFTHSSFLLIQNDETNKEIISF